MYNSNKNFFGQHRVSQFCDTYSSNHTNNRGHVNELISDEQNKETINQINYVFLDLVKVCETCETSTDIIKFLNQNTFYINHFNNSRFSNYKEYIFAKINSALEDNKHIKFDDDEMEEEINSETQFIQFIFNHLYEFCKNAQSQGDIINYLNNNKCFSHIMNDKFYSNHIKEKILIFIKQVLQENFHISIHQDQLEQFLQLKHNTHEANTDLDFNITDTLLLDSNISNEYMYLTGQFQEMQID